MISTSSKALGALALFLVSAQALEWGTYACMKSSGDMTKLGSSPYQCAGLCQNLCEKEKGYFFALQGEDCWCGSQPPAFGSMGGSCDTDCPGYPYDKCGGDGTYSVWELEEDYSNPSLESNTATVTSTAVTSSSASSASFSSSSLSSADSVVVTSSSATVASSSAAIPSAATTTPVAQSVHTNAASRPSRFLFF
ncbi:hypothetical protein ASPACDRAFT_1858395 [Aspergillus aculeatus ATCC 16872]|uniref:WSC domain-containing protein n=1 Tax=Aspergillus aculeatus (strain ATCC 16872 / CBS 172.66 / WB 5094) TaxID=690307 RepID=A0A1L9WN99_ASPA1|nr:uncharacterized protein ASPACDRAFT_1858395 [Aspergillus aculeatus ATCC 16872]OJJ97652.1 hypothetical protein ASPACDRAFT_1858395 [Aspergillus aculeatus ATCC 16872]